MEWFSIQSKKGIEAYLKIDSGCEDNGYLKTFKWYDMIDFAKENGCTGTKMRSIVKDVKDLSMICEQQFALAESIHEAGLMPIVEPRDPQLSIWTKNFMNINFRDEIATLVGNI